jgi:hypothetical protein
MDNKNAVSIRAGKCVHEKTSVSAYSNKLLYTQVKHGINNIK